MKYAMLAIVALSVSPVFAQTQPNIVLIMADDIGWECFTQYGGEDYKTPHLDALATEGVRFENCYSTPICTPSRVKLMTGCYNFRNYTHFGYLDPQEKTFAHMLKQGGYKTAIAGKWQLNGLYHQAPGCLDNTRPFNAGFDEYCLWQVTKGKGAKDGGGERFWSPPLEQNGTFIPIEDNAEKYGPDIMSDFLCDFIDRNKDEPFFVYYPMVLVHDPFVTTPDTIGDAPRTQAANKAPNDAEAQKANFVAMVNYMDKIIGKIVERLEAAGELDNTIILFTADNGTNVRINSQWNGRTIQGGKGGTTDTGTHVPLIAYWKDRTPQGEVIEDLIDFTDFYATFAEAAGIELGENDPVDGRSFLPQLMGQEGESRDWVLWHYQPYWGRFPGRQFIRDQRFKLYRDGNLFDVSEDFLETEDLSQQIDDLQLQAAREILQGVLDKAPPAPTTQGGRLIQERPVYPEWPRLSEPGD